MSHWCQRCYHSPSTSSFLRMQTVKLLSVLQDDPLEIRNRTLLAEAYKGKGIFALNECNLTVHKGFNRQSSQWTLCATTFNSLLQLWNADPWVSVGLYSTFTPCPPVGAEGKKSSHPFPGLQNLSTQPVVSRLQLAFRQWQHQPARCSSLE